MKNVVYFYAIRHSWLIGNVSILEDRLIHAERADDMHGRNLK